MGIATIEAEEAVASSLLLQLTIAAETAPG